MELDDKICYCFHVSKRKILNYIRINKPRRPSQISECGGAGTGCGWCVSYIKRFFDESGLTDAEGADEFTPEEYARQREAYIAAGGGTPPGGASSVKQQGDVEPRTEKPS